MDLRESPTPLCWLSRASGAYSRFARFADQHFGGFLQAHGSSPGVFLVKKSPPWNGNSLCRPSFWSYSAMAPRSASPRIMPERKSASVDEPATCAFACSPAARKPSKTDRSRHFESKIRPAAPSKTTVVGIGRIRAVSAGGVVLPMGSVHGSVTIR